MAELNEKKLIQVCSSCKRACCWYGEFMCENSRNASTELKTVKELRELKAGENEHYWSDEYMKKIYGEANPFGIKGNDEGVKEVKAMFNLECTKCGSKGPLRENDINTDREGNPIDCMTEIVSDENKFNIVKKEYGLLIKCNGCGNLIMSYEKPY